MNPKVSPLQKSMFKPLFTSVLLISCLIVNVIQIILHLFVKPVSKKAFYVLLDVVSNSAFCIFVFLYDYWSSSDVIVYCTADDFAKMKSDVTSFTIKNHPSDIDFMLSTVLFTKRFTAASSYRFFVKNDIKYLPGFGWMLWLNEQIFLKRSYEKDEGKIKKYMGKLSSLPNGFWLCLFPEGRIFSQQRLDECTKQAREACRESFRNLLIPKWRGFASCIQHLRTLPNSADITIHNMTIAYEDNVQPTYAGVLDGESTVAHVHIGLKPLSQVDDTKESLYEIYREKDRALDDFKLHGTFKCENLISFKLAKSKFALLNFLFWMTVDLALFFMLIAFGYSKHLMVTFVIFYAMYHLVFKKVFRTKEPEN